MKKLPDYKGWDLLEKQAVAEPARTLEEYTTNLLDLLHEVATANVALAKQTQELLERSAAVKQARQN
ncbi:hypothetical protein ACFLUR_02380 [Chloroflexota bacterium]